MLGSFSLRNAGPVVLKACPHGVVRSSQTDAERPFIPRLANRLLRIQNQIQKDLHQLMWIAQGVTAVLLSQKVDGDVVLAQRIGVQVQGPLHHFRQIDACLARRGRARKIGEILHDFRRSTGLLLQHGELLARGFVGLAVLQQLADAQDAGQTDYSIRGRRRQSSAPMAARRSLCTICCSSFFSTVISRTEIMTPLSLASASNSWLAEARMVRQLPSRCRAPYSAEAKDLLTGGHVVVERSQFRRMIFQLRDLFPQHVFRLVSQQIAHPRTDEGVAFGEIDHQNQVRETFEQPAAEFLLLQQLPLPSSAFR